MSFTDRGLLAGRYEHIKMLGKGGFGIVEQYVDRLAADQPVVVAIKTIPSTFVDQESKRLVRELDIMLHLYNRHPYVMSFLDMFVTYSEKQDQVKTSGPSVVARPAPAALDTTSEAFQKLPMGERQKAYVNALKEFVENVSPSSSFNLHIVLPLMKGDLLHFAKHVRAQNRIFSSAYINHVSVVFAFQICFGLDYLHKCNVVHRDLKPDNILVGLDASNPDNSIAVIADFGLARDVHETETFYICTRHYRPPEVITCTSTGKPSIDIWSLGCILYELVTATTLFTVPSARDVLGQWEAVKASQQLEAVLDIVGTPNHGDVMKYTAPSNVQSYLLKSVPRPNNVPDLIQSNWKLDSATPEEKEKWISLITSCLAFFPEQRPTAEELCRHELFSSYNVRFGENVVQYAPRRYESVLAAANSMKLENKKSALDLVKRAVCIVHHEKTAATNGPSSVAVDNAEGNVTRGLRCTPAQVVFPADLDENIRARFVTMPVASNHDVDVALDAVLYDLEQFTHDASISAQLRALLNYFVVLKQMRVDGEQDEAAGTTDDCIPRLESDFK